MSVIKVEHPNGFMTEKELYAVLEEMPRTMEIIAQIIEEGADDE